MTKERLSEPFSGFDSMDPRMERIPNDLNDKGVREKYLEDHKNWFLDDHSETVEIFEQKVQSKYGNKMDENLSLFANI